RSRCDGAVPARTGARKHLTGLASSCFDRHIHHGSRSGAAPNLPSPRSNKEEGAACMRIGILTGGGDVPGLNPCIKTLVNRAAEHGWSAVGFRRGWAGPLNIQLDRPMDAQREWVEPLDPPTVRTIDRTGGTHLHTSRTNP